jgi:hypothetical protein
VKADSKPAGSTPVSSPVSKSTETDADDYLKGLEE